MKRYKLNILIIIFFLTSCSNKFFIGTLESETRITALVDTINVNDYIDFFGTKAKTHYQNGYVLNRIDSKFSDVDFFDLKSGRYYFKHTSVDHLYYYDKYYDKSKIIDLDIIKNDTVIKGFQCNRIDYKEVIDSSLIINNTMYFSSSAIRINPRWYNDFKLGSKDLIMRRIKSIPLYHIMEYPWARFEFTITEIKNDKKIEIISEIEEYITKYEKVKYY